MDVRDDTSSGDHGSCHEFIELLIVADCKLDVTRCNGLLLVLVACVSCKFENLACQVLEDGSCEDSSTDADLLSVASLSDVSGSASDWESQVTA